MSDFGATGHPKETAWPGDSNKKIWGPAGTGYYIQSKESGFWLRRFFTNGGAPLKILRWNGSTWVDVLAAFKKPDSETVEQRHRPGDDHAPYTVVEGCPDPLDVARGDGQPTVEAGDDGWTYYVGRHGRLCWGGGDA